MRRAISADLRYARPVISPVIAAAYARPSSESYGSPRAISSAPRFAYPKPSWRYAFAFASISGVGYDELPTAISCARNMTSTACVNASTSSSPSSRRNFIRFSEARLQALSSIDMYSLHGLDALILDVFGSVCQLLIVVSYWTPGSAHCQAASAMSLMILRALTVSTTAPSVRAVRFQSPSAATASMNVSVTRTELLAFWYWIDAQSFESSDMSNPACSRTRAFFSSLALHQMNSSTSGWSTSRTTIFAARRVLPPDLIVPAEASAPRMKLTGPDAVPPPRSLSYDERIRERFVPAPDPPRKIVPSSTYQLRIDSMVSSTA